MTLSAHDALLLLALLGAGAGLLAAASKSRIPYPILLVLGGLVLGLIPGLPSVTLEPEVVLVGILPPLLYSAALVGQGLTLPALIRVLRLEEDRVEEREEIEARSLNYQRLRRELLEAERRAVVELRRAGRINDEVMNRIQRDLDLEDARLEV